MKNKRDLPPRPVLSTTKSYKNNTNNNDNNQPYFVDTFTYTETI